MEWISVNVLKNSASELATILTHPYQIYYGNSIFPSNQKTVRVQPAPKEGPTCDSAKYRLIRIVQSEVIKKDVNRSNG